MMILSKRKAAAAVIMLIAVLSTVFLAGSDFTSAQSSMVMTGDNGIKETYTVGDIVELGAVEFDIGGKDFQLLPVIHYPDGKFYKTNSAALNAAGRYMLEYKVNHNGKTYRFNQYFTVYNRLFTSTNIADTIEYGQLGGTGIDCLNVSLSQGATLNFNQIIDLNSYTKSDKLIGFYPAPADDRLEAKIVYVVLTDAYDPSNSIKIRVNASPDNNANITSYVSATFNNYLNKGRYSGAENSIFHSNNYGFARRGSFVGLGVGDSAYEFDFYFDNTTGKLYSSNNVIDKTSEGLVINYKQDFDTAWEGFTTGEVYLSMYADSYALSSMNIAITGIYGYDLSKETSVITKGSDIDIDFGEYTAENYPDALVGAKYKVYDAALLVKDANDKLDVNVYYGYDSSLKHLIKVTDGYFDVTLAGVYTIEYLSTDVYGNRVIVPLNINAVNAEYPITLEAETADRITNAGVMETVAVSGVADLSGGFGALNYSVTAVLQSTGEEFDIKNLLFTPPKTGTYKITYKAYDFYLQEKIVSYDLTVDNGTRPIINTDGFSLPKYMISGAEYTLPQLIAKDYTGGSVKDVVARIEIKDKNGIRALTDTKLTPDAAASGGLIEVIYTAVSSAGGERSESFKIPVIDTGLNGSLKMDKYFYGENMEASAQFSAINLTATAEGGKAEFINKVIAAGFNTKFVIGSAQSNYSRLNVYLTDSVYKDRQIKITFIKTPEGSSVSVNGGKQTLLYGLAFGNDNTPFDLTYSGGNISVIGSQKTVIAVTSYLNGEKFKGFESNYLYCAFEIEGRSGDSGASIQNINNQPLSNDTDEYIPPQVLFVYDYGGRHNINTEYAVRAVTVSDVLHPHSSVTVTITDQDKKPVLTKAGLEVTGMDCSTDFSIMLSKAGTYKIAYRTVDGFGNVGTNTTYNIIVRDRGFPVIQTDNSTLNLKTGESFKVPDVTVTDDLTSNIKSYIYIRYPSLMHLKTAAGVSVSFDKPGDYAVVYIAKDSFGNTSIVEKQIIVR